MARHSLGMVMPGAQSDALAEWVGRGGWLVDVLLPRTDRGVLLQLVVVLGLAGIVLWRVRHDAALRFFVASATFFVLGLFALRASH